MSVKLLPAPAGMIPPSNLSNLRRNASPRTRGDDPLPEPYYSLLIYFSPHPRG